MIKMNLNVDPSERSKIEQPEIPTFTPFIPEHLTEVIKDNRVEKHLVEKISVISQQNNWQNEKIQNIYGYTKTINGKVIMLEEFRQKQEDKDTYYSHMEEFKKEQGSKNKKLQFWFFALFSLIVYPLYLSIFAQLGPGGIIEKFLTSFVN